MPQSSAGVTRASVLVSMVLCLMASPGAAATHQVPAGGDLQAVLDAALPGDLILLESGATFVGNFKLPVKAGESVITIRTNAPARSLPSAGVRMDPRYAPVLAKIKSPNLSPALSTAPGSHHWRVELLEFEANANGSGDIIVLGASGAQTQLAQMPFELVFDRVYVHGDPVVGQKRGIALNSGSTDVINSYISDIKSIGQDSQAIAGWNGAGPFLIENNYLEGAGENLLFGGADPSIPGLVPSDITIRRNLLSKPLQWRTERWQIKNAFELKNARRVLVEGNVFENVWGAAQSGYAILFTPRNQDGRAPWSVVEDVTFRYNTVRHAGNGFNITGYDDERPSQQTRRIRISHNVLFDIDGTVWNGAGIFVQIGNEPRDVTIDHNTVVHTGNVVTVYGARNGAPAVVDGFIFRDNLMRHNRYGIKGTALSSGQQTMDAFFRNYVIEGNVLAGGPASAYPAGNYFPTLAEFTASFVAAGADNFSLVQASPFRNGASDGTAVGADVTRVKAMQVGGTGAGAPSGPPAAAGSEPPRSAECRPGRTCTTLQSSSSRRLRF